MALSITEYYIVCVGLNLPDGSTLLGISLVIRPDEFAGCRSAETVPPVDAADINKT